MTSQLGTVCASLLARIRAKRARRRLYRRDRGPLLWLLWHLFTLLGALCCFTAAGFSVNMTVGFVVAGCCFMALRTLIASDKS